MTAAMPQARIALKRFSQCHALVELAVVIDQRARVNAHLPTTLDDHLAHCAHQVTAHTRHRAAIQLVRIDGFVAPL
jgi:hypothetical protein